MSTPRRAFDAIAALAAGSLILAPVMQAQAQTQAQTQAGADAADAAAGPGGGPAAQTGQESDLPARVGRLSKLSGTVSFHTADEDHWNAATLNYPVTSGDAFWTEPQASASVEIGASTIAIDSTTELDIDQLDATTLTATQAQGETFFDLRDLQAGETYTIRTPRGAVTLNGAGRYEIEAGDTQTDTRVTVVEGSAQVAGDNLSLNVAPGQTATITGSGGTGDPFRGSVAASSQQDSFLEAQLAACAPVQAQLSVTAPAPAPATATASASVTATAPAAVRQMPGGNDLSGYGAWEDSTQYGQVWYPRVASDWAPYRDGHWAWVPPWGWTWIDSEAWGYAPFHYGRWLQIADRWAWAPVYYAPGYAVPAYYQPVYAPALVSFFGFGAGLAAGLAIGGGIGFGFGLGFGGFGWGHIGWCPLGWGEPYRPWFGGARYFNRVNRYNVENIHNISYNNSVHNVTINNYANAARGATVVPTTAMLNSQRIAREAQPFGRAQFSQAHPVSTPPRPTTETAGVTRAAAQRLGLPDAGSARGGASAPGPRLEPREASGAATRADPALRPASGAAARSAAAGGARALQTGRTEAPQARAGRSPALGEARQQPGLADRNAAARSGGLPALRTAGAVPRATGGAPGPAFTPRREALGNQPGGRQAGGRQAGGRQAGGRQAGEAAAPRLGSPAANTGRFAAAGQGGASRFAPGPAIQSHAAAAGSSHYGLPSLRPAAAQASARAPEAAGPRGEAAGAGRSAASPSFGGRAGAAPSYHAPAYHAPAYHAPSYRAPPAATQHYSAPQYRAPQYRAPQYRAPQYRAPQYQAPRYQAPRYQAPQYRAPAYQAPHFSAPRAPAGGGRRPFPP